MNHDQIEYCVELICNKGCRLVREDIERLESGEVLPETHLLDGRERHMVLLELKNIMAVYGDVCRI